MALKQAGNINKTMLRECHRKAPSLQLFWIKYHHIYFTRLEEDCINSQIKTSQSTHSFTKYKVKESSDPRPNNSQSNTLNDHKKSSSINHKQSWKEISNLSYSQQVKAFLSNSVLTHFASFHLPEKVPTLKNISKQYIHIRIYIHLCACMCINIHTDNTSELKEICYYQFLSYQDACGQLLHNTTSQCGKSSRSFAFPEFYRKSTFNISVCLMNQCVFKYL